jgi:putative phage-type endonuclease
MPKAIALPNTLDWTNARASCIGASEAAAACGVSPYAQPLDIYRRKVDGEETPDNQAMALGRIMEPAILDAYEYLARCKVERGIALHVHDDFDFIGATPDAMRRDGDVLVSIDAKFIDANRFREFGDENDEFVPDDYFMQAQQQCFVMGADRCDLAVMLGGRMKIFPIQRDARIIKKLVEQETMLWERILKRDPPPFDPTHPRALDLANSMFKNRDQEKVIDLPPGAWEAWTEFQKYGAIIRELEEQREAFKAAFVHAMGDAGIGVGPLGKREVYRREVSRESVSLKDLPADVRKLVEPFVKKSSFPRFYERDCK